MRISNLLLCLCLAAGLSNGSVEPDSHAIARRQDGSGTAPPLPTLTPSGDASQSPSPSPSASPAPPTSEGDRPSSAAPATSHSRQSLTSSISIPPTSTQSDSLPTPTDNAGATNETQPAEPASENLPLDPRITPAFGFGGVILIITGVVYALIGIKNRWIHVFLSTGYLTSLSILILIVYVMNPPVSDAIQGAYFVGIFMTGLIFGCGALIFKEVTEGLGCLLGGFCLAMWFMTLKPGGIITNESGVAIFIAVFCVVCWALSFSHYTRSYALMGSTSFAGATAFILGVDCFSRGGLKEFWVYTWSLNDNLFPLNTNTYPITRGMRVESIVIILGTIIGIISQVKLWTVVRNRRKEQEATRVEDEREREAVEEAIGRHLQRQNDRDRSEWEKRYGDRIRDSKRQTVSWHEAHPEKRHSTISTNDVSGSQGSSSSDSVEMTTMNNAGSRTSHHGAKGKRQSVMTVQAIPEADEDETPLRTRIGLLPDQQSHNGGSTESVVLEKPISAAQSANGTPRSDRSLSVRPTPVKTPSSESLKKKVSLPSLRPQSEKPAADDMVARINLDPEEQKGKKRSSIPTFSNFKRRSLQQLLTKSTGEDGKRRSVSPLPPKTAEGQDLSESREALVVPTDATSHRSRASSVAATVDEDNEPRDLPEFEITAFDTRNRGMIGPGHNNYGFENHPGRTPREDAEIEEDELDEDPEELVRSPTAKGHHRLTAKSNRSSQDASETIWDDGAKSMGGVSHVSDALTQGALQRVPSQLSHVVMSYRTNEWAKHIAEAEIPLHEEPESIKTEDKEAPTHLTDPKAIMLAEQESQTQSTAERPPELPSPVNAVAPSSSGIKVNPEILPPERELRSPSVELTSLTVPKSRPVSGENLTIEKTASSSTTPELQSSEFPNVTTGPPAVKRSATDPTLPRANRRLSNPGGRQQTLATVPIDENHAVEFAPTGPAFPAQISRNTSNRSNNPYQMYGASTPDLFRTMSGTNYGNVYQQRAASSSNLLQNAGQEAKRSSSALGFSNQAAYNVPQNHAKRASFGSSGTSVFNGDLGGRVSSPTPYMSGAPAALLRSTTRLSDFEHSHQPISRHGALANDATRREALMAEWRITSHNQATVSNAPKYSADTRRAQMLMDRENEIRKREKEQNDKMMREAAYDQGMRSQGMIEAHREMMRKMQSQASKNL